MQFGIISTHWMCEHFCETMYLRNDLQVVAVYSRDINKAQDFAKKNNIKSYYNNYEEMLNDDNVDAIYVCSPNHLHYEHSLKAIQSKKHVLIEKPITLNTSQLEKLYEAAKENNVYFLEAFKPIHLEEFRVLKREVAKLKDISYANFIQLQYSSKYDNFLKGIVANTFNPNHGGALYDIGIYPLYYPIALFGIPNDYTYNQVLLDNGVDAVGTISLNYGTFLVDVTYSKIVDGVNDSYIYTKDSVIKMYQVSNLVSVSANNELLIYNNAKNKMHGEISALINMIRGDDKDAFEYYYNLSYQVIKIIEEIRENNELI